MEEAECAGTAPAGGLRCGVHGWGNDEVSKREERREASAGEDRRLNPFTRLLTRPPGTVSFAESVSAGVGTEYN